MTLSEEYRGEARFAEEQSRKAFDDKNETLANHLAGGASAFRRVAELESQAEGYRVAIRNLQAQLAWTPVAKGLPTGDGEYLMFSKIHSEMLEAWVIRDGTWYLGTCAYTSPFREYSHFRKVTLP